MKISDLIDALMTIQADHGDLRVCIGIDDNRGIGLMVINPPRVVTAGRELTDDPPICGETVVEI